MFVYVTLFLYLVFLVLYFDFSQGSKYQSKRNAHFNILRLIFIVVVACSYRVGSDVNVYASQFEEYPTFADFTLETFQDYRFEPLWTLLNVTARSIGNDFFFVLLFCSLMLNIPLFSIIKNECKYPFTAILIYYILGWLNVSFEMLRQTCAVGFYLWGCIALMKGDNKGFLLKTLPCLFFHKSGIFIVLLTFVFSRIKVNKFTVLIISSLFFFGIVATSFWGNFIDVINILSDDLCTTYQGYIERGESGLNWKGLILFFIFNIFIPAYLLLYNKRIGNNNLNIFIFLFLFLNCWYSSLKIVYRMCDYVQFFFFIALADYLISTIIRKRITMMSVITGLIVFFTLVEGISQIYNPPPQFLQNGRDMRYVPYTTILDKDSHTARMRESYFNAYKRASDTSR